MKIVVMDISNTGAEALKKAIGDLPGVEVKQGNIVLQKADAVVSPANSFGFMDGGIDYTYSRTFGWDVQKRLQAHIAMQEYQEILVGQYVVIATNYAKIPWLICAPTMRVPMVITDPIDIFLATRAAIRAAITLKFKTVLMPGMGTGCGLVPYDIAGTAMKYGIDATQTI